MSAGSLSRQLPASGYSAGNRPIREMSTWGLGSRARQICSRKPRRPATDLLRRGFAFGIGDFDPAVLHPAFVGIVVRDGFSLAVALSGHAGGGDSELCQPGHDRTSATFGQSLIVASVPTLSVCPWISTLSDGFAVISVEPCVRTPSEAGWRVDLLKSKSTPTRATWQCKTALAD